MSDNYQLTISGFNFFFSKQITFDQVKKVTTLLIGELEKDSVYVANKEFPKETKVSSNQWENYFESFNAKRTPEKITAIAYKLHTEMNQSEWQRKDLIDCFQLSLESIPKNLSRDISWAEKIGWIAESPKARGSYYLTQDGKVAVESHFPENIRKKTTITILKK